MRFQRFYPSDLYNVLKTKEDCLKTWIEMAPSEREELYNLVAESYKKNKELPKDVKTDSEHVKELLSKLSQPLIEYKESKELHPLLLYSLLQVNVRKTKLRNNSPYHDLVVAAELKGKYDQEIDIVSRVSDSGLRDTLKLVLLERYRSLGITSTQIDRDIAKSRNKYLQIGDKQDLYTIDDLFNSSDVISYTVDRFITKSGLFLLAAAPKTYKSLLSYHLAWCVVRGEPFLGRFQTTKGKVLYIQLEENKETIKTRLRNTGFTEEDNDNFLILRNFDINDTDRLQEIIHDFVPSLIIVDTLRAVSSGSDVSENTAEFARPLYQLQTLANANNIAILVLHHKNKSEVAGINSVSGTSAICGATDGIFLIDNHGDKLLLTTVPRNNPPYSILVGYKGKLESGKYRFTFYYDTEVEVRGKDVTRLDKDSAEELRIENYLKDNSIDEQEFDRVFPDCRGYLEKLLAFGVVVNDKGVLVWHRNYQPKIESDLPEQEHHPEQEQENTNKEESQPQPSIPSAPKLWEEPVSEDVMQHLVSQIPPDAIEVENGDYIDIVRFSAPEKKLNTLYEAEINKTAYELDKAQPEVIFRAPKAYYERVAPSVMPRVAVHVKDRVYYRRIFNPQTIAAHVERVLSLVDFLVVYELVTEYDWNKIKEHVSTLPKSKQALFHWIIDRFKVCIQKDMPHILSDPPFTAMYTQFGDGGVSDFFFPIRLEAKYDLQFRAFLESLSLTDLPYEYHKVPPPKEAYCELHPAKISLRRLLPIYVYETDVTAAFLDQAAKIWGKEIADELKPYVECKIDPFVESIDFRTSTEESQESQEITVEADAKEVATEVEPWDEIEESKNQNVELEPWDEIEPTNQEVEVEPWDEIESKNQNVEVEPWDEVKVKNNPPVGLDTAVAIDNAAYADVFDWDDNDVSNVSDEGDEDEDMDNIPTALDNPDKLLLEEAIQWYTSLPEDFQELVPFEEWYRSVKEGE